MPPAGRLPAREVALLERWIREGATWPQDLRSPAPTRAGLDWWAFQSIARSPGPGASIDRLVQERLKQAGLGFSPPAPPAQLIRRLAFDLHGLPPPPAEVDAFVQDSRPDAYDRLVDRLLASPHYGERMARRWLDVVRFAESDGYEHDLPRMDAWPYRDWVIAAFNQDMPYDRFAREQLAGDALHPDDPGAGIPTGFLVAGGFDSVGAAVQSPFMRAEVRQDLLEDMIGTTFQAFLGLTAQCARCHDHKYDPISLKDYYAVQAALAGAMHWTPKQKRPYFGVRSETPPEVRVLARGSIHAPGEVVRPAVPMLFRNVPPLPDAAGDRPRRLALAGWIGHRDNPLFARVMANRVWGWLMGQGIVSTPNDFGFNGDRPTHPELLDSLASSLADGWSVKGLVRRIVLSRAYRQSAEPDERGLQRDAENRLLWRRSPRRLEAEEVRDAVLAVSGSLNRKMGGPGFQLFTWKENAGALYQPADPPGPDFCRRAIYRHVVRGGEDTLLNTLDCPDSSSTTPKRAATTNPVQALSLLNNSFIDRESERLAARLEAETETLEAAVAHSYRLGLGRSPGADELERVVPFAREHGLRAWCRVLFNLTEFVSLD